MINNSAFASALAGILFGFSALMILLRNEEPVHAILLGISGVIFVIHAWRIRNNKEEECLSKSGDNEN